MELDFPDLGLDRGELVDYQYAWQLQRTIHAQVAAGERAATGAANDVTDKRDSQMLSVPFFARRCLFCVLDSSGLTNHDDFNVSRVVEFLLEFPGNIERQLGRLRIIDELVTDQDTNLATRLDRVRLFYTLEACGHLFEFLEAANV